MFNKYGAIINSDNLHSVSNSIKLLEKQKYPPESYFIVISEEPSKSDLDLFLKTVVPTGKLWKFKVSGEETADYLIDEYFVTKSINTSAVLAVKGDIEPTLSEDLELITNQFPQCWFFKVKEHCYFYSVLCNYYTFDKIEEMLIEKGNTEKIYGPIDSKEHSPS